MSKSGFSVVLPSSAKSHPTNNAGKFRVTLPKQLRFEGEWLCCLAAIQIPHTWKTLGNDSSQYIDIFMMNASQPIRIPLPSGTYNTIEDLEQLFDFKIYEKFLSYKEFIAIFLKYYHANIDAIEEQQPTT